MTTSLLVLTVLASSSAHAAPDAPVSPPPLTPAETLTQVSGDRPTALLSRAPSRKAQLLKGIGYSTFVTGLFATTVEAVVWFVWGISRVSVCLSCTAPPRNPANVMVIPIITTGAVSLAGLVTGLIGSSVE